MDQLANYGPERVFYYFEQISRIPRGSGNMRAISDYCAAFARAHNLRFRQDENNNVIICKPATLGRENDPTVILQGHMDMVCEKIPGSGFNFETDAIKLLIDGDWLTADGTTLGADNGIAIAMILAILESDDLSHPSLEAVFTTDEETSLVGATALDVSDLQGRAMINLDSEDEGVLTVSCAGGVRVVGTIPTTRQSGSWACLELAIHGLLGGHSGAQIHEGRGCSNQLMGRLLCHLQAVAPFQLVSLAGGNKDNVISSDTSAVLATQDKHIGPLQQAVQNMEAIYQAELAVTDPGIKIDIVIRPTASVQPVTTDSTRRIIGMLVNCPQGVLVMSADLPGLVQTSLNMGVLKLETDSLRAEFALRSSCASQKDMMIERLHNLFVSFGGSTITRGDYPGWEFLRQSPLREHMVKIWKDMFGTEPKIEAIHAGLECGLFAGKMPGLDAVSLGPTMQDVHSTKERLSISSTQRIYEFVCKALATWGH